MKTTNYETIISNTQKAISLLRGAQVGSADMETRKSRKEQANEYLKEFVAVKRWPEAYKQIVRVLENEWFNLI